MIFSNTFVPGDGNVDVSESWQPWFEHGCSLSCYPFGSLVESNDRRSGYRSCSSYWANSACYSVKDYYKRYCGGPDISSPGLTYPIFSLLLHLGSFVHAAVALAVQFHQFCHSSDHNALDRAILSYSC